MKKSKAKGRAQAGALDEQMSFSGRKFYTSRLTPVKWQKSHPVKYASLRHGLFYQAGWASAKYKEHFASMSS